MAHDRKLVFGSVSQVVGSLTHTSVRVPLRDDLEQLMIDSNYLKNAPFKWIGVLYRYGTENKLIPTYRPIDKKDGELELGLELDIRALQEADQRDPEVLKTYFEIAALDALIHAGHKYKLNTKGLEERRAQLGNIPDWEERAEETPELEEEDNEEENSETKSWERVPAQYIENLFSESQDNLMEKRRIDHWIYFAKKKETQSFKNWALAEKFKVESLKKGDDRLYELQIYREDTPKFIAEMKKILGEKAEEYNGKYDGWEAFILKKNE